MTRGKLGPPLCEGYVPSPTGAVPPPRPSPKLRMTCCPILAHQQKHYIQHHATSRRGVAGECGMVISYRLRARMISSRISRNGEYCAPHMPRLAQAACRRHGQGGSRKGRGGATSGRQLPRVWRVGAGRREPNTSGERENTAKEPSVRNKTAPRAPIPAVFVV